MKYDVRQRYKRQFLKVKDFVKVKPFKDQFLDGKAIVNQNRVRELLNIGPEEVLSGTQPVVISVDGRLYKGNHRRAMAEKALSMGIIDPDFEILCLHDQLKLSQSELSRLGILDNISGNRSNLQIQAVMGHHELAKKVFKPIYDALDLTQSGLSRARKAELAMKLGAFFNSNPTFVSHIQNNKTTLDIYGADIYRAKSSPVANKFKFVNETAHINLKGCEEALAKLLTNGANVIVSLKENGIWAQKFNKKTTLEYVFLGLSLRNQLSFSVNVPGKISYKQILSAIKKNGRKICNSLQKDFVHDPEMSEDTILNLLGA